MHSALQQVLAGVGVHGEPAEFMVLFGLIFARVSIAVSLSPFLGGKSVASKVKVGLAVIVSALLFGSVAPQYPVVLGTVTFVCLLAKEVMIGATFGVFSQLIFHAVQMAGAMVDYGRGMSQATLFAPQLETNTSLLGQLQFQAALVLFLLLNGHLLFLHALGQSFQTIPILAFPAFAGGLLAISDHVARYSAQMLAVAVQLSAPALLALFLLDVSFGMLGRVASGLNVHNESQPVKSMVGLLIVLLALAFIFSRMPAYLGGSIQQIETLAQHMR